MSTDRNVVLFVLWHLTVLGLAAITFGLGYADPMLHGGRQIVLFLATGLYVLGVALSVVRMRKFLRGVTQQEAEYQLEGIELVGALIVYVGLAGTVAGLLVGTAGVTADSAASASASGALVGRFIAGFSLALGSTLCGIILSSALLIGARFVGNVAHSYHGRYSA